MKIRKEQGRSGVGEYWWPFDGAIVEVDGETGNELINLKGSDFSNADNDDLEPVPDLGAIELYRWASGNRQRALFALTREERAAQPRLRLIVQLRNIVALTDDEMKIVSDDDVRQRLEEVEGLTPVP